MCGIAGIYSRGSGDIDESLVRRMRDTVLERGPDDAGLTVCGPAALGHRRLSIIDLSPAGRGPMASDDGSLLLAYNGEIYNFRELRQALLSAGHTFHSHTDTEVLLRGYQEWNLGVLDRLNGMFAFALWDERVGDLILARDPVGQKPMYYAERNGRVYFGSNARVILEGFGTHPDVSREALDCFLSHSYVPTSHCIFEGIRKLPAGHYAKFSRQGTTVQRYWFPKTTPQLDRSFGDTVDRVDGLVKQAVKSHLVADVPVGAFLSGGVDSSTIVGIMRHLHSGPVRTFSVGFAEREYSELPHAREVARIYDTEHHEVFLQAKDVLSALPELVWQYGEPFGDSSAVPTFQVSRAARSAVKVSLSGDGADELFGGYRYIRGELLADMYRQWTPALVRSHVVPPVAAALERVFGHRGLAGSLTTLSSKGIGDPGRSYMNWLTWMGRRRELYTPRLLDQLGAHDPLHDHERFFRMSDGQRDVERRLFVDLNLVLPDDYFVKVDVASMAASLEVRAPFLDRNLMEDVLRIPATTKLTWRTSKLLLKEVAARYVPREIIFRPKTGFSMPVRHWLRGDLRPCLTRLVLSERALSRGYFRREPIERAVEQHLGGTVDHSVRLWQLLWLELWHLMFIDRTFKRTDDLATMLS